MQFFPEALSLFRKVYICKTKKTLVIYVKNIALVKDIFLDKLLFLRVWDFN